MADTFRVPPLSPKPPQSRKAAQEVPDSGSHPGPFLDALQAAVMITDGAGMITYWNPFAEQIYGWPAQEVVGRNVMEIAVRQETEEEAGRHMARLNSGKSGSGEFQVRCKDGKTLSALVSLSPLRDASGAVTGIVGLSQDFSRNKRLAETLVPSESQFHALADSLPELCWMADGNGYIFWYNEKWYEYTGTTLEQMEGWGWQSVHDPAMLPDVLRQWTWSIRNEVPFEMEFPLRGADGEFRWFLTRVRPVRNPEGKIDRWFGANTDIHMQRKLQESLSVARDHLEQRVRERTAELDRANADLRGLSAQLLHMRDDEARRLARELNENTGQLLAAVKTNLSWVKMQSDKLSPVASQAVEENQKLVEPVFQEIRTISHMLQFPLLDEAGLQAGLDWFVQEFGKRTKVAISLEVDPTIQRFRPELETAIYRMVQECLNNIHSHSGSKTAGIRISREDRRVVVVVEDSGRGMAPEQLRATAAGGGGVGFRSMAERIRALDGAVEIRSDGNGTAVTASLPLEPPDAAGACEAGIR